ncbi:MAG: DUF1178 family protein [Proteobacteria bacterium]|nr:DUF1178 family protein [Pseudomonadota bacterium]
MIVYDLQCEQGHVFEGWFEDIRTFNNQNKKKLIACPVCNNTSIMKVPTTFGIKSSGNGQNIPDKQAVLEKMTEKLSEFVEKNFDNVGTNFATEALKIHYGVSEPRNIRGVSTNQEEKTLKEEGIQFFKVPVPVPPETDS